MPSDDHDPKKIEAALRRLGAGHEPPEGWEARVQALAEGSSLDAIPRASYRDRVRGLLTNRLNRLLRLIALDAPDILIAAEVEIVGRTATMIDPHGMARRAGEDNERKARLMIGLCCSPGCEHVPADDGQEFADEHCDGHAAQLRAEMLPITELCGTEAG
jgi:hypothetical protein